MGGLDQSEELVALCLGGSILFFLSFRSLVLAGYFPFKSLGSQLREEDSFTLSHSFTSHHYRNILITKDLAILHSVSYLGLCTQLPGHQDTYYVLGIIPDLGVSLFLF